MVEKVNFGNSVNNVQFMARTQKIKNQPENLEKEAVDSKGEFYVDKDTAEAIKNYMTNPLNINKPVSLNDYKDTLTKAGLVEGKDFEVLNFENRGSNQVSHVIRIADKDNPDLIKKSVYWRGGDAVENYDGYAETFFLKNGGDRESFTVDHDEKGRITVQTTVYKNPENHKNLFPENIDLDTTPEDYIKLLDDKKVNYKVNNYGVQKGFTQIAEYAEDGKTLVKMTIFEDTPKAKAVDQVVYDENGQFMHTVNIVTPKDKEGESKLFVTQSMYEILKAMDKYKPSMIL